MKNQSVLDLVAAAYHKYDQIRIKYNQLFVTNLAKQQLKALKNIFSYRFKK